jgi:hypothetical protein
MGDDDAFLQEVYANLKRDLSGEARRRIASAHVYPSQRCTYTIAKERIFVKVRGQSGERLPECALRHILLHELAHVINPSEGHDSSFWKWMRWIGDKVTACPNLVPRNFNPCH